MRRARGLRCSRVWAGFVLTAVLTAFGCTRTEPSSTAKAGGTAKSDTAAANVFVGPPLEFAEPWKVRVDEGTRRDLQASMKARLMAESRGAFAEAAARADECRELLSSALGADHWLTVVQRITAAGLRTCAALPEEQRQELAALKIRMLRAAKLNWAGRSDLAAEEFRAIYDTRKRLLGAEHVETVQVGGDLAVNLRLSRKLPEALAIAEETLAAARRLFGIEHPNAADALVEVASAQQQLGRLEAALELQCQAMRTLTRTAGYEERTFNCMRETALTLFKLSRISEAECLMRCVLRGRSTPQSGGINVDDAQEALGTILLSQGRYTEAEECFRAALGAYERYQDPQGRHLTSCRSNLGSLLLRTGRYREAQDILTRALEDADPRDLLLRGYLCRNLGAVKSELQDYAQATRYHDLAAQSFRAVLGPDSVPCLETLVELGHTRYLHGDFDAAAATCGSAADRQERLLGQGSFAAARACLEAALAEWARGQVASAAAYAERSAEGYGRLRLQVSDVGLERAAAFPARPGELLAVLRAADGQPQDAFRHLENAFGRGLLDELAASRSPRGEAPELVRQREQEANLQRLDAQLDACRSVAESARPPADAIAALVKERHELEEALVKSRQSWARQSGLSAGPASDWKQIQAQLPPDAALVAWIELVAPHAGNPQKAEVWAVLVRQTGAPVWLKLTGSGPEGAWTANDLRLPREVYRSLSQGRRMGSAGRDAMLGTLGRQWVAPVLRRLGEMPGPAAVRRLLVLPSGPMSLVPLELLAPDYAITYEPSGTIYAWLRSQRVGSSNRGRKAGELLVLGNPDLKQPAWMGTDGSTVAVPLPGTATEAELIGRLFARKTVLLGADASQQQLEELAASGELEKFQYLHLATHAQVDAHDPTRSYLLLSVAGLPDPFQQLQRGERAYAGRLTTAEIRRTWKLSADLVVLSACSTGQGAPRGGEGLVGFSQVLLLAGARSCLLTLWPCDDQATPALMSRFYQNLLGQRAGLQAPLPKDEALAEAKRWLRDATVEELRAALPAASAKDDSSAKGTGAYPRDISAPGRGLQLLLPDGQAADQPPSGRRYADPYYWAGFVLIGDPD